jgi:hypothetical protein
VLAGSVRAAPRFDKLSVAPNSASLSLSKAKFVEAVAGAGFGGP